MSEIDLVLIFIAGLLLGVWLGWRTSNRMHEMLLPEILKMTGVTDEKLKAAMAQLRLNLPEDHPDKIKSVDEILPSVNVRIEEHGDQLYAYRKEDDKFLGQGRTQEALLSRMQEQNKGTSFKIIVAKEDGADLLQKYNIKNG